MRIPRAVANERGAAIVLAAVALSAVLGASALAVDAAMLVSARGQAQAAADAAALAGASAFVDPDVGSIPSLARTRALEVAVQNSIGGSSVAESEAEVEVDMTASTVRVNVRRPSLPTYFARAIGIDAVAVSATATARATDAASASCVKPWTPADLRFAGGSGAGGGSDDDSQSQGYAYGQSMKLKGDDGESADAHAWVLPTDDGYSGPCPSGGAPHTPPAYQANICNCNRAVVDVGQGYPRVAGSPGGLRTHTQRGVDDLLAQDPGARWDASGNVVVGSRFSNWRSSPRVVTIPLYDPASSSNDLRFTRFVQVFLESEAGGEVVGRYVSALRVIQLVE